MTHLEDFAERTLKPEQYVKKYWIGHYSPAGNFFAATAIRQELVELLAPKPLSYNPAGKVTFESPWEGGSTKGKR